MCIISTVVIIACILLDVWLVLVLVKLDAPKDWPLSALNVFLYLFLAAPIINPPGHGKVPSPA